MVSASSLKGKNWNQTLLATLEPYYNADSIIPIKPFIRFKNELTDNIELHLKLFPGFIQLPEVTVTAERKKPPFEGSAYVSMMDKSIEITKTSRPDLLSDGKKTSNNS